MKNFKLLENEQIEFETASNRMRMVILGQGGKLYITNQRLVFVGHGMNIGEGTISIKLEDIMSTRKAFASIIIPVPNAIKVTTKTGKGYRFVVSKRKEWLKRL